MPFNTLGLSVATVGIATLAFAIAAPASAQEYSAQKHYAHTHYGRYAYHGESRQIVVHAQPVPRQARSTLGGRWGR